MSLYWFKDFLVLWSDEQWSSWSLRQTWVKHILCLLRIWCVKKIANLFFRFPQLHLKHRVFVLTPPVCQGNNKGYDILFFSRRSSKYNMWMTNYFSYPDKLTAASLPPFLIYKKQKKVKEIYLSFYLLKGMRDNEIAWILNAYLLIRTFPIEKEQTVY